MIKQADKDLCIRLYNEGALTIKEIMSETGIRSEQTIYRILDAAGVPRRPTRQTEWRATISFDESASRIIDMVRPRNLSEWICNLIKEAYKEYDGDL